MREMSVASIPRPIMVDIADLPQPSEAFDWVQAAAGPALICRPLAALAPHLFTTRHWPLGSDGQGGDNGWAWEGVARALHVGRSELVRVRQVHGTSVANAAHAHGMMIDADIIVSGDAAVGVAVQAADCVPLLIADRQTGAVAAAHAGWRGLAAGVPDAAVVSLVREFGSDPGNLVAAIGPAIGACCYQVGEDVRQRFASTGLGRARLAEWFAAVPAVFTGNPPMPGVGRPIAGRWFFDAWTSARTQLEEVGVPPDQIFIAGLCTASHPGVLCSYRRDGPKAGRIAGAIRPAPRRP